MYSSVEGPMNTSTFTPAAASLIVDSTPAHDVSAAIVLLLLNRFAPFFFFSDRTFLLVTQTCPSSAWKPRQ